MNSIMITKVGKVSLITVVVLWSLLYLHSCSSPNDDEYAPYLNYQASISGQTLHSNKFPKGSITFDSSTVHIGSESFILYKVATCEIHLFGELDGKGGFKRLYWIQYEGYLPKNLLPFPLKLKPGGPKYNYTQDPYQSIIGGKDFYIKTGTFPIEFTKEELLAERKNKDSDFLHVGRLLDHGGIDINGEVLSVRMVHLDSLNKKELMIIYYESLEDDSSILKELENKGKESPSWPQISKELQERAIGGISIDFN